MDNGTGDPNVEAILNQEDEDIIEQQQNDDPNHRPKKRRKTKKKTSPREPLLLDEPVEPLIPIQYSSEQEAVRCMLKKELKQLLMDYPNLDIHAVAELDKLMEHLNIEELHAQIDNMRIAIGHSQPLENARSVVGTLAILMQQYTGYHHHHEELISDNELLSALDYFVPSSFYWLSPPLKVLYRLMYHLSRGYHEKK